MVNREMLLQDVSFPLKMDDWGGYIWDSENHMIAMLIAEISNDKKKDIIDAMNSYVNDLERPANDKKSVHMLEGKFYDEEGNPFLITRGWGRLQYKSEPEKRQDNISNYIKMAINTWEK